MNDIQRAFYPVAMAQDLRLNLLRFRHALDHREIPLYPQKSRTRFPVHQNELPDQFTKWHEDWFEDHPYAYTDFKKPEEGDEVAEVSLREHPRLAAHYYNWVLYHYFKKHADAVSYLFIYGTEVWFRDEQADLTDRQAYKRFMLRASVGRYTEGPELRVSFEGHRYVYPNNVLDYGYTRDLNWVKWGSNVFRYDEIPDDLDLDYTQIYPVVNRAMMERLSLSYRRKQVKNKVKRYYEQLEWFKEHWLDVDAFKQHIPLTDREWFTPEDERIHKVDFEKNKLLFKNGAEGVRPMNNLPQPGPYSPPRKKHFEVLFLVSKADSKKLGNRLIQILRGDSHHRFPGLARYINTPLQLVDSSDHITFTDTQNPLPEIRQALVQRRFDPDTHYLGIYISPIHKEDPDPQRHRVYYRVKEELLKYGISSQVIHRDTITDSYFDFALPNIAVAILAKLGGIPWKLKQPPRKELIVGVGAFKKQEIDKRYLGSTFCFSNDGTFRGFECFAAEETHLLAGSIRQAVLRYREEHQEVERLVIHFYKRMSYKERQPIMRTLHKLGLDIPVIVVTINKTESRDLVLLDTQAAHRLPVSGTYVRLTKHDVLLSNNTRERTSTSNRNIKSYPFPVKLRMSATPEDLLDDNQKVRELIEQVYQFSRIYWKSISQQSLPVTILYPEMVAQMFPYFESTRLPEFGQKNLWFL
jgi:hypothetical protein